MKPQYEENAKIIKALSDPSRLKIIDILSCGEKCACEILEEFQFTQPTLSHHMKVLSDCGLVNSRKEGLWNYYSLNNSKCNKLILFLMNLVTDTEECICKDKTEDDCKTEKKGYCETGIKCDCKLLEN
ncbi:ArsR/SmtB family transcription factor [Clostridium cellulovorans]|uniref:Transcriptional regulator, ArsR family n=1 Tax=Clostridium cellulovorans (strain ATCC 35296 / DSM 3052 / OCM 3 / 743B) TaxID=573061 RepID=D9SPH8_CLOC7|nr:metalloregulator ArsR/SmtB family transcription factor [Clostridium cellulovorans]ADL50027.1 transcriptional regulator, ArsR family [Clostridium cellulovorans 743B]